MKDDSYERIDRMWEIKAMEAKQLLKAKIQGDHPMIYHPRLITVNFEELFHDAEGFMLNEDDLMWALGMALINNYHHHPIVPQLENEIVKIVNEKAAKRKEKV